jgi:hypothetical protein
MERTGEVHLEENEDYDKWAIVILVKFRASEKLQPLTAQRQSGGVCIIPSAPRSSHYSPMASRNVH